MEIVINLSGVTIIVYIKESNVFKWNLSYSIDCVRWCTQLFTLFCCDRGRDIQNGLETKSPTINSLLCVAVEVCLLGVGWPYDVG